MTRSFREHLSILLAAVVAATGCAPTQPFFFMEDGDLSHYVDVATQIDYPDVEEPMLDEVAGAMAPLTLRNLNDYEFWDVSLEEVTRITLTNSQVMRQLGGTVAENAPETLTRNLINSVAVTTTYDPALVESATGTAFGSPFNGTGVEAALSAFDTLLDGSASFQKNDRPQNFGGIAAGFQPSNFQQDAHVYSLGLTKNTADGSTFAFRNNTSYDFNNGQVLQGAPSLGAWETNFEAFFNRPLLQGAGAQYNRIAGPFAFAQYAQNGVNPFDGVVLARIRMDTTLADFEGGVRNLMRDVEQAYWNLYFAYRDLESRKIGRDSALQTWKAIAAKARQGAAGGSADREAQARSQYYQFKAQVEQGISALFAAENRMRYIMGLAVSDGRLIRPADEPTTAPVTFDWSTIHSEAIARRVEVRKQKWTIKQRELELLAARNHLLPRLDTFGTYRWRGGGDRLFQNSPVSPTAFSPGTGAFDVLTDGNFQEWELGLQFSLPIGFRQQLSTVRHHQLLLARERALLQDVELEVSHQIGDAVRDLDLNYGLTETNFNRRSAAVEEVEAVDANYKVSRATLDLLLDAQRRRSEAETAYYRSLVDYNIAISDVHFRKGSLLDYNGVFLAEGPWPGKAHFDALRRARQRDASLQLDYGFTRPSVISRGHHAQRMGDATGAAPVVNPTPVHETGDYIVPEPAEEVQPLPSDAPMLFDTGARQPLFNAPGTAGFELAGGATGYESSAGRREPSTNESPRSTIRLASAEAPIATTSTSGVTQAYEHQADHPSDRPAAAPAIGAGRER